MSLAHDAEGIERTLGIADSRRKLGGRLGSVAPVQRPHRRPPKTGLREPTSSAATAARKGSVSIELRSLPALICLSPDPDACDADRQRHATRPSSPPDGRPVGGQARGNPRVIGVGAAPRTRASASRLTGPRDFNTRNPGRDPGWEAVRTSAAQDLACAHRVGALASGAVPAPPHASPAVETVARAGSRYEMKPCLPWRCAILAG
jgi:hypothetical protein